MLDAEIVNHHVILLHDRAGRKRCSLAASQLKENTSALLLGGMFQGQSSMSKGASSEAKP